MAPFLFALWQWRRVAVVATFVAIIATFAWRATVWHDAYEALPALESALEAERLCGEGSDCAARQAALEAAQAETTAKVVATYENELADLRNRPLVRRVIRVCADPGDVQGAGGARGTSAGAPAEGVVQRAAELDTGPLRDLAQRADELSAQCRALIRWNAALAKPQP